MKQKNQGITLIALIVTIIVLMILAGITLNLIMGGSGILAKAKNSVKAHEIAEAKERVEMRIMEYQTDWYEATYVAETTSQEIRPFIKSKIDANPKVDKYDITLAENGILCIYKNKGSAAEVLLCTGTVNTNGNLIFNGELQYFPVAPVTPEKPEEDEDKVISLINSKYLSHVSISDHSSTSTFLSNQEGRTTSDAIKIICNANTDATQTLHIRSLSPNTFYDFSAYIKTEDISGENANYGASIGENGNWASSEQITGTTPDWKQLKVVIRSNERGEIDLNLRVGFWYALTKGTATFSDIQMQKITENSQTKHIIKSDTGNVRIVMDKENYTNSGVTDENATKWANRLAMAREQYEDLVGFQKFNGKVDVIANNHYSAWAFAGDPIQWMDGYQEQSLRSIQNTDEWLFGMLHEIGHTYDDDSWNWDAEFWANTKMAYVLEKLNAMVIMDANMEYRGAEIKNYYKKYYTSQGLKCNDGVSYKFLVIKDKITAETGVDGWEAFKKTFRYFKTLSTSEIPSTKRGKFNLFIQKLSEYGGIDVTAEFTATDLADLEQAYGAS